MFKKLFAVILFLSILAGCTACSTLADEPTVTSISNISDNTNEITREAVDIDESTTTKDEPELSRVHFSFIEKINDDLPPFTFEVTEISYNPKIDEGYNYRIDVSCPELSEYTPHSINVTSWEKWDGEYREHHIDLIDINFDGYADLRSSVYTMSYNFSYYVYRWNPNGNNENGCFEPESFFNLFCRGYQLFPDTKQLMNITGSGTTRTYEMYQLQKIYKERQYIEEYEVIPRRVEVIFDRNENDESIATYTFFCDGNEIYSKILTTNEYEHGEYNIDTVVENYMKFGFDDSMDLE